MSLWRVNLRLGLKQFGAHVHAADGVPYFLLKMSVRSLELAVGHFIGAAPKVTARQCRCPFTTCRLVLLQLVFFSCGKGYEKLEALVHIHVPSVLQKCMSANAAFAICASLRPSANLLFWGQISRAASMRCVFYTVILYWF